MAKYTREEIEKLRLRDPSELTLQERRLLNLSFPEKGEVRNPNGRKKGVKNWSTVFQKLMGDPDFLKTIINKVPGNWQGIVGDTPADVIAAGLIASIGRDLATSISEGKSISKNTKDAIALLNKISYGDKVVVEDEDSVFNKTVLNFTVVPSKREELEQGESEES